MNGEIKVLEEKNKALVKTLEETKNTLAEKIKAAEDRAKKESLERLFGVISQAEYESTKKSMQFTELRKSLTENLNKEN